MCAQIHASRLYRPLSLWLLLSPDVPWSHIRPGSHESRNFAARFATHKIGDGFGPRFGSPPAAVDLVPAYGYTWLQNSSCEGGCQDGCSQMLEYSER